MAVKSYTITVVKETVQKAERLRPRWNE